MCIAGNSGEDGAMFSFLQGFAFGLFTTSPLWFIAGMINPSLALPVYPPYRWQVILRYLFIVPSIAVLSLLTSFWGGLGPDLAGWLVGLAAIPAEIFVERRWRRWRQVIQEKQRAAGAARSMKAMEREAHESGVRILDPARPPENADAIVRGLCEAKLALQGAKRPDLAVQADRLYTRYGHIAAVLSDKFDPHELTYERARHLVTEVCRGALDTLTTMASLAQGVMNIDPEFARRRLAQRDYRLSEEERQALARRLTLLEETETQLKTLSARNEAALTTLDDAAIAIAGVETSRPQASTAAEQTLRELQRFADKAQRYRHNS